MSTFPRWIRPKSVVPTVSPTQATSDDLPRDHLVTVVRLRCLIEGQSAVILVTIAGNKEISELKELIHQKGINTPDLSILAKDLIVLKVDIDLKGHTKESLKQLVINENDEGVQELMDWEPVSHFWQAQLDGCRLHVFVKLPPAVTPPFRTSLPKQQYVTVVPINGGCFQDPMFLKVHPSTPVVAMHDRICNELQMTGLIGKFYHSTLEILPLPKTPSISELEEQGLACLRIRAYQKPKDFPAIAMANFFNTLHVEEGRQGIHFLVWLPPMDVRYPDDLSPALAWFITLSLKESLNFEDATIASQNQEEGQQKFKTLLKREYDQPGIGHLFDMATGKHLPHNIVVAAHIFQRKWRTKLPWFTSLTDIDNPRNGLFLYKPVEWAFNRAKICVEVDPREKMTFRLLDQNLHNISLVNKACELQGHGHSPSATERSLQMTFGDLDGQELKFPDGVLMRPSKRLLGLHAIAAQWVVQAKEPYQQIREVMYNTSEDQSTTQFIKNLSILAWQDKVEPGVPRSESVEPGGVEISTPNPLDLARSSSRFVPTFD